MAEHIDLDASLACAEHNHHHCSGEVLVRAEALSAQRGVRLTPVRRRTLEILLESHKVLGAYEVLDRLAGEGFGKQPPVAYRALDFLVDQGLVHRINRLNAFAACMHPGEDHAAAFLICRACKSVIEMPAERMRASLEAEAQLQGFRVERANIEALGLCPGCAALDAGQTTP